MTAAAKSTENDRRNPVVVCAERGWKVGTRLAGDEGYGVTIIEITGFGETQMLAKRLSHKGRRSVGSENSWVLYCRDWTEVTDPLPPWCPETPPGHPRMVCNRPEGHEGRHETNAGWWTPEALAERDGMAS